MKQPNPVLTPAQEAELRNLKQWFPYRIVFGVLDKDTGTFQAHARVTKSVMNRALREGHAVFAFL